MSFFREKMAARFETKKSNSSKKYTGINVMLHKILTKSLLILRNTYDYPYLLHHDIDKKGMAEQQAPEFEFNGGSIFAKQPQNAISIVGMYFYIFFVSFQIL